jgi:putative nucleotidyltransferase with HDIG domain
LINQKIMSRSSSSTNYQSLDSSDKIKAWAKTQSWSQAMAQCMQDPDWHAEGDVWTHTMMVMDQLPQLEEWNELCEDEQRILIWTALFHDVAKPLTTEVDQETGRVRTPHHAIKGEWMTRNLLRDLDCDLATREAIASMVRYHGRPAFLLDRINPTFEVVRLSWLVKNRLLYLFALADTRGRDTDSMERPEENLHYWQLTAEELGCLDKRYPFATDHARYTYFRHPEPNLHYVPHEDFACTVTVMSGLPGSGKDTWLRRHNPDLPVVSLDELRWELDIEPTENQGQVAQLAQERCREFLRSRTSFAFNATNLMKQTRTRWLELFARYNARIEVVYLEPPLEQILTQNQGRGEPVPERVIRKLASRIEPPTWIECHWLSLSESA